MCFGNGKKKLKSIPWKMSAKFPVLNLNPKIITTGIYEFVNQKMNIEKIHIYNRISIDTNTSNNIDDNNKSVICIHLCESLNT